MNVVVCPACGKQTLDGRAVCEHCCAPLGVRGSPSPQPVAKHNPAIIKCSSCGKTNLRSRSNCHFCGASITDQKPTAPRAVVNERPASAASPSDDLKDCPYCAERIKAAAVKCKHCKSDLAMAQVQCPFCAETMPATSSTCPHCRESLSGATGTRASPAVPPSPAVQRGSAGAATGRRLRVGLLLLWLVLFLVIGYAVGGITSQVIRRLYLESAGVEERVVYETCVEDPDCDVPFYNGFGYAIFFVTLIGGVLVTRPTWNPRKK